MLRLLLLLLLLNIVLFTYHATDIHRMTRNCFRKDSDLISVNILLVTELLTTGTRYLQIVFTVKLLILLRNISRLHGNRELYSFETLR